MAASRILLCFAPVLAALCTGARAVDGDSCNALDPLCNPLLLPNPAGLVTITTASPQASPDELSGLFFWGSADQFSVSDGQNVTWPDRNNSGRAFVQNACADLPQYFSNRINGLPAIRFNSGEGDCLSLQSQPDLDTTQITWFLVANADQLITTSTFLRSAYTSGAAAAANAFWGCFVESEAYQCHTRYSSGTIAKTANFQSVGFFYASQVWDTATLTTYVNGSLAGLIGGIEAIPAGHIETLLGASNGSTFLLNGELAEVILYTRVLSNDERQRVERYLARKYGLTEP